MIIQAGTTRTNLMQTNLFGCKSPCSSMIRPVSSSVCWTFPPPTIPTMASISVRTMR